jgi:hypothetical protein
MMDLPPDSLVFNTKVSFDESELPLSSGFSLPTSLSDEQIDLLNGTLLGDGNLQTGSGGKSWRYRAVQSDAQEEYLLEKKRILSNLCGPTPPFTIGGKDKRTGLVYPRKGFNTRVSPLLLPFGQAFYQLDNSSGRERFVKKVPLDLADRVNGRMLAWLYGDDGALKWANHSNATRLCVEGFKPEEVQFIVDVLKEKLELPCSTEKKRNSYNVYFPEKSYSRLRALIGPYLHPNLYYRFPNGKKGTFEGM